MNDYSNRKKASEKATIDKFLKMGMQSLSPEKYEHLEEKIIPMLKKSRHLD